MFNFIRQFLKRTINGSAKKKIIDKQPNVLNLINKIQNDYLHKSEKTKTLINNNSFENIQIEKLQELNTKDAIVINSYYFYLIGIFRDLYEFRNNRIALEKLIFINEILYNNLDFFKQSLQEFEYILNKAYNEVLNQNKTIDLIKKEANDSFNKIKFDHILINREKLKYLEKTL